MTARARSLASRASARLEKEEHVLEAIVVIVSTVAFGIGITMLWVPQAYNVASFAVAFDRAPAGVWGGMLVALSFGTFVSMRADRTTRAVALGGQVIVWGLLSVCLITAVAVEDGVPSGAIVYQGLTWTCAVFAAYYWRTRRRGRIHAA